MMLYLSVLPGYTQQKITVTLDQQPIAKLFESIEQQTNYRIYCPKGDIDTLMVSAHEANRDAIEVIRQVLTGTNFQITQFQDFLFILKDKMMVTTLPDGFYGKATVSIPDSTAVVLFDEKQDIRAVSELKVYEIGNAKAPLTSRVTLTGKITDIKNGEPLPGISLFVEKPMVGTTTDSYGFYSIQLPTGRYELNIRGMGMKETKRQMMLYSNGKLDIELEEQIYKLDEVTILSRKTDNVRATTIGVERLQMKSIKNIPTVFGEADVVRIVMSLPGVKSAGEISSGYNVRGGATDQNLILYNDGTIYNPTHLFGMFSAFNPDVVKDMELYKSSIPAKYGGRISSVLDINSREGNKKEFQGSASLGLLTSRVTLEGPIFSGKGSYIVGGRTTYSDWLLKRLPEKSGYKNGNAGFYDLNGTLSFRINEHNNIYLNGYYSHDRFRFQVYEQYAYQNANVSGKWRHIFSQKFTSTFVAGYDHYSYETNQTEYPVSSYSLNFGINQVFGKADFSYYLNNRHTIGFGLSSIYYELNPGKYLPKGSESLVVEDRLQIEKAEESALYVDDQWEISPAFSIQAGIRYAMFNVLGPRTYSVYDPEYLPSAVNILRTDSTAGGIIKTYHGPEFRFSLRYVLNENTSIKAGVNTMRQFIHKISNTTIMSPTDTWKLSDANIRPQTGVQYVAGLFRNFANNTIETSIEVYYKTMDNYLDYRKGAEIMMNHHIETEVVGTEGRAYGAELMIKKSQGKLNGWVSYTYSRTMLRQYSEDLVKGKYERWYPADFDKPHEIKLVGNYKFTHRYSFSLNCDYSTGRPITLPVSKYYYAGGQYVYYAERNKYRIPDFFRIDISFNVEPSHHLTLFTHSSVSVGIYNLTGRKNAYSVYYVAENGVVYGRKLSIFGVPIPYISYNIKF